MQSGNNQSSAGDLSLHELAADNDVQNLTFKILFLRQDVDIRDEYDRTPLHVAAIKNRGKSHYEVFEILLSNGADPNTPDWYDKTPLWYLVENGGYVEILNLFLTFNADFTCLNKFGSSLLIPAIGNYERNSLHVLKFLVQDIGLDVNHKEENSVITPLHHAANINKNESHYEIIKFLLEMGSEVNARDFRGRTPLYNVIRGCNSKVFDLFMSYKADFRLSENILLAFFNDNSDVEVLNKLFSLSNYEDSYLDVNQKDSRGLTPLHRAIIGDYNSRSEPINMKFIKCLLKNHANINAADNNGIMPLTSAVSAISEFNKSDEKKASHIADFLFPQADFSVALEGLRLDNDVGKWILKHLARLTFLKIPVHATLLKSIDDQTECKDYFVKCTNELEIMSRTRPRNSWITFFNLLVDNRRKLKNYAGNEGFIEDYKNNDWGEKFPIYGDSLKKNVKKGLRRRELFDKSAILLTDCLPISNPNHLIVKDILDCILSIRDLSKFLCE